jgi:uncharacterized cupredoxin-like copper-binding protein
MLKFVALAALLSLLIGRALVPVNAEEATPAAQAQQADPVDVAIELREFSVKPATTTLVAGQPYHFMVTNKGTTTHELVIEPAGASDQALEANSGEAEVEDIAKGETKDFTWTFDQPGSFQFACHVADHFQHGMVTPFTVVPAGTQSVKVDLRDFSVTPERTTLKAGTPYLLQVTNHGEATHELVVEPAGKVDKPLETTVNGKDIESEVEDIAPGETKTLLWTFSDPGKYQMACHVPGHFEAGMKATFDVTP